MHRHLLGLASAPWDWIGKALTEDGVGCSKPQYQNLEANGLTEILGFMKLYHIISPVTRLSETLLERLITVLLISLNEWGYLPRRSKKYLPAKCSSSYMLMCDPELLRWLLEILPNDWQYQHMSEKWLHHLCHHDDIQASSQSPALHLLPGFGTRFHGSYWVQTQTTRLDCLLNQRAKPPYHTSICIFAQASKHTVFISKEQQKSKIPARFGFRYTPWKLLPMKACTRGNSGRCCKILALFQHKSQIRVLALLCFSVLRFSYFLPLPMLLPSLWKAMPSVISCCLPIPNSDP